MTTSIMLCLLLAIHFVADFLLQSRGMAKKKSEDFQVLLNHVTIIYFAMLVPLLILTMNPVFAFGFAFLNSAIHAIIDWNIWKLYKLGAHKRIIKQIREEYKIKFGESTWVDDQSLIEVTAPEMYKEKVKNWQYWEDSKFYDTIGLDQYLHTITIILLFFFLI